jgi:hypothetical protein
VGQRDPEHPLAPAADEERRPARPRGARLELAVAGLEVPSVEVDGTVAEERPDDREGLLEAVDPMVEREAEGPELGLVPARAEPEDEASATDLVDRGGHLRQHRRAVEGGGGDEGAQADPGRRCRERRQHRPGLPGAE